MGGRFIGRRGSQGDSWTWETPQPAKGPPPAARRAGPARIVFVLLALGAGAVALGAALLLLSDSGNGPPVTAPTSSPSPIVSRTAAASPTPPTATVTPSPAAVSPAPTGPAATRIRLAIWSKAKEAWVEGGLTTGVSGYQEGEAVPVLLEIAGVAPDRTYDVTLRYDCALGSIAAFDFLTSYSADVGAAPAAAKDGPGRERPDAAIPLPSDPSIAFDDAADGQLALWGGTFDDAPQGPTPRTACIDQKTLSLRILAHQQQLFLVWGAHLAASTDWGPGRGAADQATAFGIEAGVVTVGSQRLVVAPGAVAR